MATALTVTGHTLAENLKEVVDYPEQQQIVRPCRIPSSGIAISSCCTATSRPRVPSAKITGKEGLSFTGRARVFDGEEAATEAILSDKVRVGDVVVIRHEGPRGGPGMREMLSPTSRHCGAGVGQSGRIDHRWTFLRRQSRLRRRTYCTGSRGGRPDSAASQRRSRHHRCRAPAYRC